MLKAFVKRHNSRRRDKLDFVVPAITNYNPTTDPTAVGDTIITNGLNFIFDANGTVETAKGYVKVNTTALPSPPAAMWEFETTSLRHLIVATVAGYVYRYDNVGGWVTLGGPYTASAIWDGVQVNNKLVLVNGYDGVLVYNGTTLVTQTITGYALIKPQYVTFRKNRLYFVERGTGTVLWISQSDGPATPNGYFTVVTNAYVTIHTDNGELITGLDTVNDNLTIFKARSVHNFIGEPIISTDSAQQNTVQVRASNSEVGCISHKTIATVAGGVQIFAADSGVYMHQGYATESVSKDLERIFREDMNPNYKHTMWGNYNPIEKKYLLGYPSVNSTTPDKVIMIDLGTPEIRYAIWDDMPGSCAVQYKFSSTPVTLMGDATRGNVYELYRGYVHIAGDNGTATGGTTTTLIDTTKAWTVNQFKDCRLQLLEGTGNGQTARVLSNTSDTLTLTSALDTAPGVDTVYTLGAYHSFIDTKQFDFDDPGMTEKYKYLNIFCDSEMDYDLHIGVAYGKQPVSYSKTKSLNASDWYFTDDESLGWTWGSAALRWGQTRSLFLQVGLGGNDRFIQARFGTLKANQPWRIQKFSFTFKDKKARPL